MSIHQLAELHAVRDTLTDVLTREHALRPHRPNWLEAELMAIRAAVNRERDRRRLPPVDEAAITAADRLAAGHTDYVHKFTLYCAELACGLRGTR